eukprot:1361932-Pyramimonas_sp.AAC.1
MLPARGMRSSQNGIWDLRGSIWKRRAIMLPDKMPLDPSARCSRAKIDSACLAGPGAKRCNCLIVGASNDN